MHPECFHDLELELAQFGMRHGGRVFLLLRSRTTRSALRCISLRSTVRPLWARTAASQIIGSNR